jgi:pre-mRNA-processing factor 39
LGGFQRKSPAMSSTENGTEATPAEKPPLERYREAVEQNPLDFNSWVQLLALVETESAVPRATVEATFDKFLAEFPLCFGYWNKVGSH